MASPSMVVAVSLTIRPLFLTSPVAASFTLPPPTNAPVFVRSTVLACARYTFGTNTDCTEPSGSVTFCETSHTMSLVSCFICASDRPTPTASPNCLPYATPLLSSAVYSSR
ncbi:hypothetical protein PHO31112_05444 [Pandoraea horticolens]|uniref:Secreted protein n=1 Tax=Pandoraea horticolens TaxID=2508298 RepID=A0A5E4ZD69_9BURK|nr:hypothetical protein PHO31112_05444 [Pandoraea horticolens]